MEAFDRAMMLTSFGATNHSMGPNKYVMPETNVYDIMKQDSSDVYYLSGMPGSNSTGLPEFAMEHFGNVWVVNVEKGKLVDDWNEKDLRNHILANCIHMVTTHKRPMKEIVAVSRSNQVLLYAARKRNLLKDTTRVIMVAPEIYDDDFERCHTMFTSNPKVQFDIHYSQFDSSSKGLLRMINNYENVMFYEYMCDDFEKQQQFTHGRVQRAFCGRIHDKKTFDYKTSSYAALYGDDNKPPPTQLDNMTFRAFFGGPNDVAGTTTKYTIATQAPRTRGAFYVAGGETLIDPIVGLIEKSSTVYLSVDKHPQDHVSFQHNYKFPAHCVDGTVGQRVVRSIFEAANKKKNCHFFIKACHQDVDSFGAVQYVDCKGNSPTDAFCEKHQNQCQHRHIIANCKDANDRIEKTGSFRVQSIDKLYDDSPCEGEKFVDFLRTQEDIEHVYVCGLAGDWCVLDTCINLKKHFPEKEVYFLTDFTKFSRLQTFVIVDILKKGDRYKQYPVSDEDENEFYLNHPNMVSHLLQNVGVRIVKGGSDATRDDRYVDQMKKNPITEEEKLEEKLARDDTALFVIDMQNDFALPPFDNAIDAYIEGLTQDIREINAPHSQIVMRPSTLQRTWSGSNFGEIE